MKKIMMTLMMGTVFVAGSAMAKPMLCNYVDNFHVGNSNVSPTISGGVSGSGDITVNQTGSDSFQIHDHQPDPSACNIDSQGTARVTYALNANDYCTLQVTDAPFLNTPAVQANCHGNLTYTGMSYDGTMTYSYSLSFSH